MFNFISDQGYKNQYDNEVTFDTKQTVKTPKFWQKQVLARMWKSQWDCKLV